MKFKLNIYLLSLITLSSFTNQITIKMDGDYCKHYILFNIEGTSSSDYTARWIKDIREPKKQNEEFFNMDSKNIILRETNFYTVTQKEIKKEFTNSLEISFVNEDDTTKNITFVTQVSFDDTISDTKEASIKKFMDNISKPGSLGTVGYESGDNLIFILRTAEIKIKKSLFETNIKTDAATNTEIKDYYWINCLIENENNLQDYYLNEISYNYAFWMFVFLYFGYFLVAVFLDEEMDPLDYKENSRTYHPIYSIRYFVTKIFTKRLRLTQLYIELTSIIFLLAWFTQMFNNQSLAIRLTAVPLAGCVFGIFPTYLGGVLVNYYYQGFRTFVEQVKGSESVEGKMDALEVFEKSCFRREYVYYCYAAAVGFATNVGSIFFMNDQLEVEFGWWVCAIVISLVINYCFLDVLVMVIAGKGVMVALFKKRAFWIDVKLQDDYDEVAGEDN